MGKLRPYVALRCGWRLSQISSNSIPSQEGERYNPNFNPITEMLRQWSVQASGEPEPEPAGEELWEQEMERLCSSQEPVRLLPYAMVDKRFIRWVPEHPAEHSGGGAVGVGRGCTCWLGGWKSPAVGRLPGPGCCSAWPGGHAG